MYSSSSSDVQSKVTEISGLQRLWTKDALRRQTPAWCWGIIVMIVSIWLPPPALMSCVFELSRLLVDFLARQLFSFSVQISGFFFVGFLPLSVSSRESNKTCTIRK